jgi:hypothetical protein
MATLRELGVTPAGPQGPATLRGMGITPAAPQDAEAQQFMDTAAANSMGELRKGFASGLYGGDANALAGQVSSLRAGGRNAEADALMPQIELANQKAATFAPTEPSLYDIGLNGALRDPGRVGNWALGAVGQGTASMVEPVGAEVGLAGAGKVLGALPWAPVQALGKGLQYGAPLAAGALNYRQNKGEFVRDAWKDPAIMAGKTPQELENAAMVHGALAGSLDTALPHMVAGRVLGKPGLKALGGLSRPAAFGLDLLGEGVTETGQEGIKQGALSYLNPNRDKSGDLGNLVDSFAGGIAGAGPVSGLSHLAGAGHARVGTPDDPNNDLSKLGAAPAAPAALAEDKSLKGAILKRATERKADDGSVDKWYDAMQGVGADGAFSPESLSAQHEAVTKELAARADRGDAEAAKHLSAIQGDPADPTVGGAVAEAADYITGDGSPAQRQKLVDAYKDRKLNEQGEDPRASLAGGILEDAVPEKAKYESNDKGYFTNLRARARDIGAQLATLAQSKDTGTGVRTAGQMRDLAGQAVDLYGGAQAQAAIAKVATALGAEKTPVMQRFQQMLKGSEDRKAWSTSNAVPRTEAAHKLVAAIPVEAKAKLYKAGLDITDDHVAESLLHHFEQHLGRADDARKAIEFKSLLGAPAFEAMTKAYAKMEGKVEPRKPVEHKPADTDEKDGAETTTPGESDDLSEPDNWELDGAKKNIEKAPGAKLYMFRHETNARDSLSGPHPFTKNDAGNLPTLISADKKDQDGTNSLARMQERVYKVLGGDEEGVETETKRPADGRTIKESLLPNELESADQHKGMLGTGSYRIRTMSAKEVMDDRSVASSRRVTLLRQYLRKDKVLGEGDDTLQQISTLDRKIRALKDEAAPQPVKGQPQAVPKAGLRSAALERLTEERREVVSKLAERMGVDVSGADDLGKLADAYFSTRFLVSAEQMAEKDQLRLNVAEVVKMIRHGAALLNKSTDPKVSDDPKATQADMNLIRFKSPQATAKDGVAAIAASDLVAWVTENQPGRNNGEADGAHTYRDKLMEGIGALLADGHMEGAPYMLNAKGEKESFENGFPPSLKLGRKTQADIDAQTKAKAEAGVVKSKRDAATEATLSDHDRAKQAKLAAERQHKAVAIDQLRAEDKPVNNTDAEELLDQGKEAKRDPLNKAEYPFGIPNYRLMPENGQPDLPGVPAAKPALGARYWDEPAAPSSDTALRSAINANADAVQNPDTDPFTGKNKDPKVRRVSGTVAAPETMSRRSEDTGRTQLDAEPEQTDGVPTDRTDQRNLTSALNQGLDKIQTLTPTNAMSRAAAIAGQVLGQFHSDGDPRGAFTRTQQMIDSLSRPVEPKANPRAEGKDQLAGGKFYAAPLAHILTPKNSNAIVALARDKAKAKVTLREWRGKVADAILSADPSEIAQHNRVALARLLTGDEKLTSPGLKEALTKLLPAPEVKPKAEPAGAPAPAPATEGRKLNEQATPAGIQAQANAAPSDEAMAKAKAYIAKVLGPKVKVQFLKDFDAAGEWVSAENLIKLALGKGPGLETVAHHEALHAFFSRLVEHNPEAAAKLKNVLGSGEIYERVKGLLRDEAAALEAMARDPEERVAYAFQFWAAGALDVDKPATTLFDKFRRALRTVLGMVRESEIALDIMTAFHEGKLAEPDAASKAIKKTTDRESWNEDVKLKWDKLTQRLHYELSPAHDVLDKEAMSATIRSLGAKFFSNPGDAAAGQHEPGFINARTTMMRKFSNQMDRVIGTRSKLNDKDRLAVIEALQAEDPKARDTLKLDLQRKAYDDVHNLLERYHQYATGRGMKLEYISNYFPRIWDVSKLIEGDGKAKFVAMLNQSKYDKVLGNMLTAINVKLPAADRKSKEDLIDAMHRSLVDRGGVDDNALDAESDMGDVIFKPFFASSKERSFKWLESGDIKGFLEKDLVGALSRYFQQGVRAAEFTNKFGEGGQGLKKALVMKGNLELDPSTGKLEPRTTYGPAEQEMYDHLAEKGVKGDEAKVVVDRHMGNARNAVAAMEGSLGGDISDGARKLSSALIAYQNLRLLPLSLFAAFGDVAGLAARTDEGGLGAAYEGFVNGLRDVFANWKRNASDMPGPRQVSPLENMAEAMGVVDSHMFLEQVGKAHTSEFMTDAARNIGRKLFMVNGLTAWDRSMRVTATKFATQFLERHKALPDKEHSARWLAELGLKPADITLDNDGKLVWDRNVLAQIRTTEGMDEAARAQVMAKATKDAERIHNAVVRWVEGAVLSPNAGLRPSRASDPHYAVFYHLKQFTYAMHHVILKRAWNEARQGNMNPIGALSSVIPIMIVSDVVKGMATNAGSLPDYMKTWNAADWIEHGASRGGLAGKFQLGADAMRDPFSLFGPTVEQAINLVTHPADLGKNVIDAVPGLRMLGGTASHIREVAD